MSKPLLHEATQADFDQAIAHINTACAMLKELEADKLLPYELKKTLNALRFAISNSVWKDDQAFQGSNIELVQAEINKL